MTFDTKLDGDAWLKRLAEKPHLGPDVATRRWLNGLVVCESCTHDFRPSTRGNVFCDDCTFQHARRRLHMRDAKARGRHTAAEWESLLIEHHGRCAYCPAIATTKDHIIPVSAGGSDSIDNITPSCAPCNSSKGARALTSFEAARSR